MYELDKAETLLHEFTKYDNIGLLSNVAIVKFYKKPKEKASMDNP